MEMPRFKYRVRDKIRFLFAAMNELAGDSRISFEGDLSSIRLLRIDGAFDEESPVLKRNTISPRQDFVAIPLNPTTIPLILSAIGGSIPKKVLHIQIEKNGQLQFGVYDSFHPGMIYLGALFSQDFMESLLSRNIITPLKHLGG